jgi:hypothetical protein
VAVGMHRGNGKTRKESLRRGPRTNWVLYTRNKAPSAVSRCLVHRHRKMHMRLSLNVLSMGTASGPQLSERHRPFLALEPQSLGRHATGGAGIDGAEALAP